jgi:ribonuclease HII
MVFRPIKHYLQGKGYKGKEQVICGLDEVGRGPLAGPLVACALILTGEVRFKGLKDSKKMSALAREKVAKILQKKAIYGLGEVTPEEIDQLGIIAANNLAFNRALKDMERKRQAAKPDFLVVDGLDKLRLPYPHLTVIRGDEKLKVIACASIMAKVTRDRLMVQLAKKYPHYGFEQNKGYGTASHLHALKLHGPCPIHRKNFAPVRELT